MKSIRFFFAVLFVLFTLFSFNAAAYADLRFFLEDAAQQKPVVNEGYMVNFDEFIFSVVNSFKDKAFSDVSLVMSVPNQTDLSGLNIMLGDTAILGSAFSNSGAHPVLGSGIYDESKWTEADIGQLAKYDGSIGGADTASLSMKVNQRKTDFVLHIDAYGKADNPGNVPASNDITVTPEPLGASLFLFGIGTFIFKKRKK
jgi:hypothetical protein